MNVFSRTQLRELAKARRFPLSIKLGFLEDDVIHKLLEFYRVNSNRNVIVESVDSRKRRNLPMESAGYIGEQYGQVYLQELRAGGDIKNRYDYSDPLSEDIVGDIESITGAVCRMRIAGLKPARKFLNISMILNSIALFHC